MLRILMVAALVVASACPAAADVKAKFLGDKVYATDLGCQQLDAIAAGGDKNIETVPEFYTASGVTTWESHCVFTEIKETKPGLQWSTRMTCSSGDEDDNVKETITLDKATGAFEVTGAEENDARLLVPCSAPEPKFD